MALEPKDLGATTNVFPESSVRIVPRHNKAVKLLQIAGAPILELGFPLQESGTPGSYEPWANVGGKEISAFISPRRHQASATGETLVVVMIEGDIHRDAVQLPAGEVQANLDAKLRSVELRRRSLLVFGLEDVSL